MKYLKRFNEELRASTYKSVADKLTKMGHKRRGAQMLDYAGQKEKEEERKRLQETRDEMSRFEPFNLIIGGSQQKRGKFYIMPTVETDWFSDMLWDWIDDKMSYIISLPFEFGIMAADEETEATFENWPWSPEQWNGVSYPNRMYLSITNTNSPGFDSYDNDIFYFATRADAMRFKKMFVDLLEEKNEWYFRKWYPNGFVDRIKKYVSPDYVSELIEKIASRAEEKDKLEESEQLRNLLPRAGELNYQNVIDSAKNIRINQIYKD
jgi:hypothetical protein